MSKVDKNFQLNSKQMFAIKDFNTVCRHFLLIGSYDGRAIEDFKPDILASLVNTLACKDMDKVTGTHKCRTYQSHK